MMPTEPHAGGDPYRHDVEVPYFQVDQQGVVFNMWYLAWIDEAFAGFLGDCGVPYRELLRAGHDQQLVHLEIDWGEGIRYGDRAGLEVVPRRVGCTSFTLEFTVRRERAGEVARAARATVVYVNIDTGSGSSTPLPDSLRDALQHRLVVEG